MEQRLVQPAIHFGVGTCLVFSAYGLSDLLERVIHPQLWFDIFGTFQLVYLPHGVAILLTWVYGWLAVLILLPATLLSVFLLLGPETFGTHTVLLLTMKILAVPLTFEMFRLGGVDARGPGMALNWRVLFLIGLLGAVLNNLIRYWLGCCGALTAEELLLGFTGSIIGDMVGLCVVMVGAMFFFRALRRAR